MLSRSFSWVSQIGLWVLARPYTAGGFVVLTVLAVSFLRRSDSEWEYVYVQAAHHLRSGRDIYQPEIGNSYPPFAALTALPFTNLTPAGQRWLWLAINLAGVVFMLNAGWRLSGGSALQGVKGIGWGEHLTALVGGSCGVFYLQNCLAHQQTDVVLGALLLGGCLLLRGERSLMAATCFGLAAAVKCTPLLWVPYLVWRRRPVAAAWLVAVAVGVNLLPDLVQSPASGKLWVTEYAHRFLLPMGNADHYIGTWASALVYNQSLSGAAQRWFVTACDWTATDCAVVPRADALGPRTLRLLVLGAELGLVALTLGICRRPFQRLTTEASATINRQVLEQSVVFLLMLLLSPMSSKAHFGVLILPGFCLARAVFVSRRYELLPLLVGAVLIAVGSNKDPLGERLYTLSLWLGCVTWQTLLLLAGCLALLARSDKKLSLKVASAVTEQALRSAA